MSEAGARAAAFVAQHRHQATELGERLSDLIDQPSAFLAALRQGLPGLADPEFDATAERASPGTASAYVVRAPLLEAIRGPLEQALAEGSSIPALQLGEHLSEAEDRDLRLFALPCLRRSLQHDPEQTWQVLRRMGHRAGDWVEVDSLADLWARGILAERFRWAELEQLLYSQQVYERRLIGATLATLPHRVPSGRRDGLRPDAVERALELIRLLMGDAEVMVQKALSWALREWSRVDAGSTAALLVAETAIALEHGDGARAWVIRDSLTHLPAEVSTELRRRLSGVRRDRTAPSTSIAAGRAAGFAAVLSASNDAVAAQGHRYTRSRT